jgi:hypothetical protein
MNLVISFVLCQFLSSMAILNIVRAPHPSYSSLGLTSIQEWRLLQQLYLSNYLFTEGYDNFFQQRCAYNLKIKFHSV